MPDNHSLFEAIHERVELRAYDVSWPRLFFSERDRLLALLPGRLIDVQHIGSTAVPGLAAKPIIDILVGVESIAVADALAPLICASGYTTSEEFNASLTDRKWFMRWKNGHRTHHLHVVAFGGKVWLERLAFREALRHSAALAAQYSALKEKLAALHAADRDAYTLAKSEFIRSALQGV